MKMRKDKRYHKNLVIGKKPDGTYIRKSIYGKTQGIVNIKVRNFLNVNKPEHISSTLTVSEWANKWLDSTKADVEYNSRQMYKDVLHANIIPAMGDCLLKDVNRSQVQEFLNNMIKDGHRCTARKNYMTLDQMFKLAIIDNLVLSNPLTNIKKPVYKAPEKRPLTEDEKAIIDSAELPLKDKAFVYTMRHTGVRREEIIAFTRGDINLKNDTISVNKAIYFKVNKPGIKGPKRKASNRVIPILDVLKPVLTEYLEKTDGKPSEVLFPYNGGNYTKSALRGYWGRIMENLSTQGLTATGITMHTLRHTFGTDLLASGIPIKMAQSIMGHGSAVMTGDVYGHVPENTLDVVRDKMNGRKKL